MEKLEIAGNAKTPSIDFDNLEGILLLKGRSNPENAREFYQPIVDWMREYIKQPAEKTELRINLEHFNTSSSKFLMEILKCMRHLAENDHACHITWMYEEDDLEMLDTAEAFEIMVGLEFEKISFPETHR